MYKNIVKQEKLKLKDLVDYQPGQVVSKTLVQNSCSRRGCDGDRSGGDWKIYSG